MIQKAAMRLFALGIAPLALSACSDDAPGGRAVPGAEERIACAIGDGAGFSRRCTVERGVGADGLVLTMRHPDGGFRRLLVARDGRGVVAADGAEAAEVRVLDGNLIEVAIGAARYRLPATIGAAR